MSAAHLSSLINSISASFAALIDRQNKLETEIQLLRNGNLVVKQDKNNNDNDKTIENLGKDILALRSELKHIKEEPKSTVTKDDILAERTAFQKDISTFQVSANFKMEQYVNKLVKEKLSIQSNEINSIIDEKVQSIMNAIDEKLKAQENKINFQLDAKLKTQSAAPLDLKNTESMFASLSDIEFDINTANEVNQEGEQKKRGRKPTKVVVAQA